ncbi:uncharacterized protein [Canis lupus baileyi]|uniref:uncharacterized protein n=1 Tax=Canis lupus baileyi TaxID=143281 RepID=UPI003B96E711
MAAAKGPRPGRSSCPRLAVRGALVAGRPRRGPPARVGPWGGGRCSPTLGLPPSLPLRATRPSSRWRRRGLGVGASARPPGAGSSRDPVTRAPRPCGAASDEEADGAGAGGRPRAWAENGRRGPAPGGCGWRPRPLPAGTERHEGDRHGQSAALGDRGPPGVSTAAPPRVDPHPRPLLGFLLSVETRFAGESDAAEAAEAAEAAAARAHTYFSENPGPAREGPSRTTVPGRKCRFSGPRIIFSLKKKKSFL